MKIVKETAKETIDRIVNHNLLLDEEVFNLDKRIRTLEAALQEIGKLSSVDEDVYEFVEICRLARAALSPQEPTECPGCGELHSAGHGDSCACDHCPRQVEPTTPAQEPIR